MVTNTPGTVLVDGVDAAFPVYKRNDSEVAKGLFYVADGSGGSLGALAFVKTGDVVGYYTKPILLYETAIYNISGVAIPTNTTVYMSISYKKYDLDSLKNNVVATAYADENGNFNFSNVSYSGGRIYLWTTIWAEDASTVSLTYIPTVVDHAPIDGRITSHSFSVPEGNYKNPRVRIKGTCPEDVTKIYISLARNASITTYLMEHLVGSRDVSNGAIDFEYDGEYGEDYVVWCVTTTEGDMTIDDVTVEGESLSTCLSGDTMITMADGSVRRMDSISVGDMILTKDSIPSCVQAVHRGQFSDYHTLYYFENDIVIDETHPHRFYNVDQGFWQRLKHWNIGDHAIDQNGNKVALLSTERIEEKAEMFGIWTDAGTYYANGLLSGEAACNKELLKEVSVEQAIDMMLSVDEKWLLRLIGLEGDLP